MPYTQSHEAITRCKIIEAARVLFNRVGFAEVTIDQVMANAGLTRARRSYQWMKKAVSPPNNEPPDLLGMHAGLVWSAASQNCV